MTGLPIASDAPYPRETIPVFARWFGSWQLSLERRALSVPELTRRYDQSAPGWNQTLDRMGFPDAYESMLRQVLRKVGSDALDGDGRVLDCGAGTGALSRALARVSPTPFTLDAIDISPRMLESAGHGLRESGVDVTLRQGDVCALPYDDDVFDLVMTAHVLEHVVDPGAALAEMVRVLKPGGLFIASVTRRSLLGMMIHLKWRTHRLTASQVERLLEASGLENVTCLSFGHQPVCRRLSVPCIGRKALRARTRSIHHIDRNTRRKSL